MLLLLQPPGGVQAKRGQDLSSQSPGHLLLDLPSEVETIRSYNRFAHKIQNPCGFSQQKALNRGPGAMQARPQDYPGLWELILNILEQNNKIYQSKQNTKKISNRAKIPEQNTNPESNNYIDNSLKKDLLIAIRDLDYEVTEATKLAVSLSFENNPVLIVRKSTN